MKEKKKLWIGLGAALILILIVAAIFLFGNTKDQKEAAGNTDVVESTESTTEETTEETAETTEETKESEAETEESVEETEETAAEETLETEAEETEETQENKPTPAPTKEPTPKPTTKPTEKPAPTPTPTPSTQPTPDPTKEPEVTPAPTQQPTPEPTPEPTKEPEVLPPPTPTPTPSAPEHEHAWIEKWMYTPTCGNAGYVTVKCSLCGAIDEERTGDVPALGHTVEGYIIDVGDCVSPSCTAYRCTVCGAENVMPNSFSAGPGNPEDHNWQTGMVDVFDEETFEVIQVEVTGCTRCGAKK